MDKRAKQCSMVAVVWLVFAGCGEGIVGGSAPSTGRELSAATQIVPNSRCNSECDAGQACEEVDPFGFWNKKEYRCVNHDAEDIEYRGCQRYDTCDDDQYCKRLPEKKEGRTTIRDGRCVLKHVTEYRGCYASDGGVSKNRHSDAHGECGIGKHCKVTVEKYAAAGGDSGATYYNGSCVVIPEHECKWDQDCEPLEDCQQRTKRYTLAPGNAVYGVCVASAAQPAPSTSMCAGATPLSCGACGSSICKDGRFICIKRSDARTVCGTQASCAKQGTADTSQWACVGDERGAAESDPPAAPSAPSPAPAPATSVDGGGSSSDSLPGVGASCSVGWQGGTCRDVSMSTCASGFKAGYCPGPAAVQCCLSSTSGSAPGVGSACRVGLHKGLCRDVDRSTCSSGFKVGYCPGPANVQCCEYGSSGGSYAASGRRIMSMEEGGRGNDPTVDATGSGCPAPSFTRDDGVLIECWQCVEGRAEVYRDGQWQTWNGTATNCTACNGWLTNSEGNSEAHRYCRPAGRMPSSSYYDDTEPFAAPEEELNSIEGMCAVHGGSLPSFSWLLALLGLALVRRRR